MKKAIYKPSNQKNIVLNEANEYTEIFIDGEEQNFPLSNILFEELKSTVELSTLEVQL